MWIPRRSIDYPEGRETHLDKNTVVKGLGSNQQDQIGWTMDFEAGVIPGAQYSAQFNNNII